MLILLIILLSVCLLYSFSKIVDAFVLPIYYCINGDRDLETVDFDSYVPFKREKI